MQSSVDLTPRTEGLLSLPVVLIALLVVAAAGWWVIRRRETHPEYLPRFAVILWLLGANVLFFWRPFFTAAHIPMGGGDLSSFFFTLHAYSADRITSGELPLWNPHLHGGMPHLGNFQAAVLYPPNLIAWFVSQPFTYAAMELLAILHYLIASAGVYLLLRSLGAGRVGAVAGGLLFAYGGFFVAHLGHYSMISAAAWIPWLFWATGRLFDRPTWPGAAVLAILTFLMASGGHQQTLLFALSGAGLWWLFLTFSRSGLRIPGVGADDVPVDNNAAFRSLWNRDGALSLVRFAGGLGAGLLMAAPMIIPSLQLAQRSVRSTLSIEQASEFSVQPVALLQLILPTVFGSNPTDYWGAFSSGEIWGYMGVTTLVLAVLGVSLKPSATRIFFVVIGLVALLYAVGPAAPIHGWFFQFVPGFDLVRAPARAYVYMNLAVAVLAGLAISDLSGRLSTLSVSPAAILARTNRVLLAIIAVTGLLILPYFYTQILGVNDPSNRPVITVDNLWMLLIFLSLLLAVLWLIQKNLMRGAIVGLALAGVLILDLFSATMPFNPTEQDLTASYREPEITSALQDAWQDSGPFRVDVSHPGLMPNFGMLDDLHAGGGVFDPMQPAAYTNLFNRLSDDPNNPAYDLLNIHYLILPGDTDSAPGGFELMLESEAGNQLWEREDPLPRAWFVSNAVENDSELHLDLLQQGEIDPRETVLLEEMTLNVDGSTSGSVEIVSYDPERIEMTVDADGPGYVVLSEGSYPGWNATASGDDLPVLLANGGLRAVPVDESTSDVVISYEARLELFSAAGSIVGLLMVVGAIAGPIVARRSDRDA